jgi:transcription elongation GreA/GreB family factor
MTIDELDRQGKTNSKMFLACCEEYRTASRHYSSNTGEIKSVRDITNNLRAIEKSQHEENMSMLFEATVSIDGA